MESDADTNAWTSTTQILYSEGTAPLVAATEILPNDISGQGQYHFGLLKKPTAIWISPQHEQQILPLEYSRVSHVGRVVFWIAIVPFLDQDFSIENRECI